MRWLILATGLAVSAGITGVAGAIGAYYFVQPGLPAAETIRDIPLQVPLRVFSRDGELISEIGERRRIPITYYDLPEHVVHAFIAAEDRRFFKHPGIDYQGILRSFLRLLQSGETPPETYQDLWNTILAGDVWHSEIINRKKNGERYWASISIAPVSNDAGEVTATLFCCPISNSRFTGFRSVCKCTVSHAKSSIKGICVIIKFNIFNYLRRII